MKVISIFLLFIFVNFSLLSSLSSFFDWDVSSVVVLGEEDAESSSLPLELKKHPIDPIIIPNPTFDFFAMDDFLLFQKYQKEGFVFGLSIMISIFSPPPEIVFT